MALDRRGQVWLLDAMVACSAYALLLLMLMIFWSHSLNLINEQSKAQSLQYDTLTVARMLISQGSPSDWEARGISQGTIPGILGRDGSISSAKLAALATANVSAYDTVRDSLGVGDYGLYIEAGNKDYEFGMEPFPNSSSTSITRLGILNGTTKMVTVILWQ